jgi:hypothetical protein
MADKEKANSVGEPESFTCGIVMPISPIDGCSADHWLEVRNIIQDSVSSIERPKFTPRMVSDSDDVGVIQKRIVQNLYDADIIVCDVSGKNANVMFELGMRLAFDKPVVLIKDDKTTYSFDTGPLEHIPYPRDLRFTKIVSFKAVLAEKVRATYEMAKDSKNASFLKSFGQFKVAQLDHSAASPESVLIEMVSDLQREIATIRNSMRRQSRDLSIALQDSVVRSDRPKGDLEGEMLAALAALGAKNKVNPAAIELVDLASKLHDEGWPVSELEYTKVAAARAAALARLRAAKG